MAKNKGSSGGGNNNEGKVLDFDPTKRFTKKEWAKFKEWVNAADPEKVGGIMIFLSTLDGEGQYENFERYGYAVDWLMLGLMSVELDHLRHELAMQLAPVDFYPEEG